MPSQSSQLCEPLWAATGQEDGWAPNPWWELQTSVHILRHPFSWQDCHGSISVGNRITTTTVCCECVFLPRPHLCCYADTHCTLYTRQLNHFCNRYSNERLICIQYSSDYSYINICDFKATHKQLIFQDLRFSHWCWCRYISARMWCHFYH